MSTNVEITWMTLVGLSLLFVGGFVLWVYGTQTAHNAALISGNEGDGSRQLRTVFVKWFLLYGGAATFAGIGCLLTVAAMVF